MTGWVEWLLGPWPMMASAMLWLLQAVAYGSRQDWGHTLMATGYCLATWGLVWAWYRPAPA